MHYNTRLLYTPALEPHEFNDLALILNTETIGSGPLTEVIEVALGDTRGKYPVSNVSASGIQPAAASI